jgi:hypothetical protein
MVEAVSNLLEKMKRGEQTGIMFVSASATGDDITGVYGDFADRLQYAIYAATKHLDALVTRAANSPGIGHSSTGAMEGSIPAIRQELPRMLRLGVR